MTAIDQLHPIQRAMLNCIREQMIAPKAYYLLCGFNDVQLDMVYEFVKSFDQHNLGEYAPAVEGESA